MMDKFIITIVGSQELGHIISKMIFHQYGISTSLVDSTEFDGYRVMADNRYSEIDETLCGFAEA